MEDSLRVQREATGRMESLRQRRELDLRQTMANRRQSGMRDYKPPVGPRPPDFTGSRRIVSDAVRSQAPQSRPFLPNPTSEPFLGLSSRRNDSSPNLTKTPSTAHPQYNSNNFQSDRILPISHINAKSMPNKPVDNRLENRRPNGSSRRPLANGKLQSEAIRLETARPPLAPAQSPSRSANNALKAARLSAGTTPNTPEHALALAVQRQNHKDIEAALKNLPDGASVWGSRGVSPRTALLEGVVKVHSLQADSLTMREAVIVRRYFENPDTFSKDVDPTNRGQLSRWVQEGLEAGTFKWYWDGTRTMSPTDAIRDQHWAAREGPAALKLAAKRAARHRVWKREKDPARPTKLPLWSGCSHDGHVSPKTALLRGIEKLQLPTKAEMPEGLDGQWRQPLTDEEVEAVYMIFQKPDVFPITVNPGDEQQLSSFVDEGLDAGLIPRTWTRPAKPKDLATRRQWVEEKGQYAIWAKEWDYRDEAQIRYGVLISEARAVLKQPMSPSRPSPEPGPTNITGRSLSSQTSYCSLGSSDHAIAAPSEGKTPRSKSPIARHQVKAAQREMVPPVPALPKSFDSTTSTVDEPFFESFEAQPVEPVIDGTDTRQKKTLSMAAPAPGLIRPQLSPDSRFRRRFTMDPRTAQNDTSSTPRANRQTSQPYKLPPLNVLPLSEQTSERIQSMARTQGHGETAKTPPPLVRSVHPPSTPMTASKASFSHFDFRHATSQPAVPELQASSSQGRQPSLAVQDRSPKALPSALINGDMPTQQVNGTKSHGEARKAPQTIASAVNKPFATRSAAATPPGSTTNHPWRGRSRPTSRADERQALTAAEQSEPPKAPTPSSKRRMSLRFRRTSSKTPNGSSHVERLDATVDATIMPPPKLPASKVSTEPPTSSSSFASSHDGAESASKAAAAADRTGPNRTTDSRVFSEKPFAKPLHLVPSQRSLSSQSARSIDPDTLAADDEMKRLASKKREFEISARELDALQRRANPGAGVSPGQASRTAKLNIYETGEVVDFPEVYFWGHRDTRKVVGDAARRGDNFGFDDERGDYNIVASDHLAYRYEVVDVLGKGSFGQVVRCIDHKHGKLVAVKIIRNKKRFHQQALVECNILQKLREWDPQGRHCMINFTESFYFRNHLCIATELLGMNLYEFIKAHEFRGFSLKLIRRFTKQMLSCLSVLQGQKVIHCDLKPENILLAHPLQSAIKTIDFGSSCFENEKVYTYIQSRFYRSPEVILGMDYGMPIDMWSMGCILAELYTGYPIFPGENEQEQLACIMEVFGPPERHLIEKSSRKKVFFDSAGKPRATVSSKGKRRRPSSKTLQQAIKCDDEAFLDFLTKCLKWDPEKRLKPNDALAHDFITGAKSRSRMSMAPSPIKRPLTSGPTFAGSPSRSRPLPDPPSAASIRRAATGAATNAAATASNSPLKMNLQTRRQSIMNVTSNGMKRNPNGMAMGPSGLPRSVPARPDMASAAALASVRNR